ncbi:agamous-like MADS-box protein AGL80 [Hevea brasiliensis]|nr:agamous-like MADS-box protein AGL80 [Hevea brasiliensis]
MFLSLLLINLYVIFESCKCYAKGLCHLLCIIMGRRKVKHELISNESARKLTFKKRRAGLLKKLMELTTLCGVIACAIIFSAYNSSPDIWPSHPEAVSVLEKFKRLPPKKQSKYMMDQESFLTRNISKLNEKLEKQRKKNERIELELIYAKCITGENLDPLNSLMNMNDISHLLKENLEYMTDRIDAAKDKIEE